MSSGVNSFDRYGKSALHRAAIDNDFSKAEKLVTLQKADVNSRDACDRTPLHLAAENCYGCSHFKLAELLLKNGAKIDAKDMVNLTPLWYLVKRGNVKMIELFLNFGADFREENCHRCNLLFEAAEYDKNVESVQFLINLGLKVNHEAVGAETPLHDACKFRTYKIIKCFLQNKANTNAMDSNEMTPLIQIAIKANSRNEKRTKKFFIFMMEHTDFNLSYISIDILLFRFKNSQEYFRKWILEHMAKLQSLDKEIHSMILENIPKKPEYDEYYKECQEELLQAKNSKLKNSWVTFHNLLVDGRKKLKNYAGNKDLIDDFKSSDCIKKFPIYGDRMDENVKKGISRRELFDESTLLLSDCLPIFNPMHLIIKDILDCVLSKKDLRKFCR